MSIDVKKTLRDAGYVTVGVGVLATQQASLRRRAIQKKLGDQLRETRAYVSTQTAGGKEAVTTAASEAQERFSAQAKALQEAATTSTLDLLGRTEPLVEELRQRVEPLAAQLQVVPDQLSSAIESGREHVQKLAARAN